MELSSVLPLIYLLALTAVLGVIGLLVFREVMRNRRQEGVISRLQGRLAKGKGTPEEHYELGSVYLEKKLYDLAIAQFRKAIDVAEEDIPVVCNAMGYTYFLQEQYDLAIRFYKSAVEAERDYATAWNNLAHAYEKKNLIGQAVEAYETALAIDPDSDIAKRRSTSLRKRLSPTGSAAEK
ncbi:tetratricopeptide repeat protein [Synechococcus sp. PCC 7336]|uniref:tetratricopeptide repeat protein n=1 Tax=Synechococcus sp. PCC 7336 TaxID=195250 RepID=UPI00034854BB|nr:tetratricopeptide repeat protein [Synechococcus sp. PCC 7336]